MFAFLLPLFRELRVGFCSLPLFLTIVMVAEELYSQLHFFQMKFSSYFLHTRQRSDRKDIQLKWIKQVYELPDHEQMQADGRKRKWGYIKEVDKYLRIVVLEDNKTVHNAFFDRDFKK
jgi:hypothetical protein